MIIHPEAVVDAFANHPCHFAFTAKHILAGFFANTLFLVSQEVTHQFLTLHAKGNEPVTRLK